MDQTLLWRVKVLKQDLWRCPVVFGNMPFAEDSLKGVLVKALKVEIVILEKELTIEFPSQVIKYRCFGSI